MSNSPEEPLKSLLRAIDPAAHFDPLSESDIRRVVAAAERDDIARRASPPPRPRRPRWLATGGVIATVGAGLGVAALAALFAAPAVQTPPPPVTGPATCASVTVDALRQNDTAFAGRVTKIVGDEVTLSVTGVYAGHPPAEIEVPQISDPGSTATSSELFVVDRTYLVGLIDGFPDTCGQTGPASTELTQLYEEAFGAAHPR